MIKIVPVETKRQLKLFVDFPTKLYKDNPYFVPFLRMEEINTFNKHKNPAYEFCETRLFLAYKDEVLVGRIAGLINHAYIKKVNQNLIRFTRFDVIDDIEVTKALIKEVEKWGKERGLKKIMGPIGFTDLDEQGMLIKGFDCFDMSITLYNHDYYNTHLQKLGFQKDVDWVEFLLTIPETIPERVTKMAELVKKRFKIHRLKFKSGRDLGRRGQEIFKLLSDAYIKLYGTVPLTKAVAADAIRRYLPLVNLDFCTVLANEKDEIIGFGLAVPSLAKAFKKNNGRLSLIKGLRVLRALKKNDLIELFLIAIRPDYQNFGINSILLTEGFNACKKNNIKFAETGPQLETNNFVINQWKELNIDSVQHRSRRCYIKEID